MSWKTDMIQRVFIQHLFKFYLILFLMVASLIVLDKRINFLNIASPFVVLIVFGLLVERFYRRVAYEINISNEDKKIQLSIYRSNKVISLNFHEIKKIAINGYLIFTTDTDKFYFGAKVENSLFQELSKIKQIQWGPLCNILGPTKSSRDEYDKYRIEPSD